MSAKDDELGDGDRSVDSRIDPRPEHLWIGLVVGCLLSVLLVVAGAGVVWVIA